MKNKGLLYFYLMTTIILSSCSPKTEVSIPTNPASTIVPTLTLTLTATKTALPPTSTPTPTATATSIIIPRIIPATPQALVTLSYYDTKERAYRAVAWSPDGKSFALAGDGGIYLYQTDTLDQTGWLQVKGIVHSIDFSPNGKYLASDSGKTTLLWDVSTQQLDFTFINPSDQVLAVEFSHDGKLLGTGGADGKLYVVEVETRKTISVMKGHTDWINSISFSSNGSTLASASLDGTVRLWNVMTGENLGTIPVNDGEMYTLAYDPVDNNLVASGGADGMIRIWNINTLKAKDEFYGGCVIVTRLAYSPDGKILAWGGLDGRIRLWDTASQQLLTILAGHDGVILGLKFSPDGKNLLSSGSDGTSKIWDLSGFEGK